MASAATRIQIVEDALTLAGRSSELTAACRRWLDYGLRDLGLTFRFPELRKKGAAQTLAQGSMTASLPADLGAGMEKAGMLFGSDNRPIFEVSFEEFAVNRGFPIANETGRPFRYTVDLESGLFTFDKVADQAYPFTPVYFKAPPEIGSDPMNDGQKVWIDNDALAVHILMLWIYCFTEDPREAAQEARVDRMVNKWKRELVKMGGTSRVLPSPQRFKNSAPHGMGIWQNS